MKQFLHASSLRSRLASAALALAFGLLSAPAVAAPSFMSTTMTISANDAPQMVSFMCDAADVGPTAAALAYVPNPTAQNPLVIRLHQVNTTTGEMSETGGTSISIPMTMVLGSFFIEPVSPGTVTLTVMLGGVSATMDVTVTAPDNIVFTRQGSTVLYYPEGGQQQLHLDFGYNLPQTVTFQIASTDDGTHVTYDQATLTVPQHAAGADFAFNALDGANPSSITFTFTGDTAYTGGASATVMITNVAPVLQYPSRDPDNPTPVNALAGAPYNFSATATDASAADRATLQYHWSNSADTGANVSSRVSADGEIITVTVSDKDGGTSETGYFIVTLLESSKILFTDECTLSAIVTAGGNGTADFEINPATTRLDDASNPWNEATGNDFKAANNTMVRPILGEGTYPFGWMFPDPALASAPSDLYIPNPNVRAILINTPAAGAAATIRYFSSNPFKDYWNELTLERIDNFGDFDQDGLSDEWEAWYLDGGKDNATHSFDEWQTLAVTVGKGVYGSSGTAFVGGTFYNADDTADNDRVPTARYEEIDNVWTGDPYYAQDGDNKVRVFLYPLTGGGNYVDYGTHVGEEDVPFLSPSVTGRAYDVLASKRSGASKPFFSNILEFRGLQQTSSEISADIEHAPNWVSFGYPGILSRTNLAIRGNCPGTDPTVADTDGDGLEDGWEYYFWTTILYENKPQYWRAYDPTFTLYPNLAPGGSADFRATGFPLMRQALEGYEAEWDGGLFVRYAPQTFEPELIRDECYYGSPNLDPTTRSNKPNYLTNAPIAAVAYYDDPMDEEPTPAVVFMMGGLEVYTRDGHVDALGRAKLFYNPRQFADYIDAYGNPHISYAGQEGVYPSAIGADTEPGEIPGAYVDFLTGQFFLPGYDAFPTYIQEVIGSRDAELSASYRTLNGLFPKEWLLNQFDPRSEDGGLAPNIAQPNFGEILGALGLSANMWNPVNDLDGDGVPDADEFYLGTNPLHWDTDNDGLPDGWEILFDLDPHDPADATKNPDCDMMYVSGPYRHCDALLYDYFQQFYWNGAVSLGFIPGAGAHTAPVANPNIPFTSREEFYVQKWMIGKDDSGNWPMFTQLVYPSQWVDAGGEMVKSLNPRSDDSNQDNIPDGWALYAGYKPAGSIDLIDHVYAAFFPPNPFCPKPLRPDPDDQAGDGLGWRQEFENWTMYETRQAQIDAGAYLEEEQCVGHYHDADWYKPTAENWTNKLFPTDPWHGDTDGDGVADAAEYQEADYDYNGDGNPLVNLNPSSADTRFDRMGDAWHYYTGTYDTTNALGFGKLDVFGPYGDPDCDGLPNYQEYLAGAVYGWRYDKWYSPDHEELWVPFGEFQAPYSMKDEHLAGRIATDPWIAANYSIDPIPGTVERLYEVAMPLLGTVPIATDGYPYGKSVHFQPYRPSDFFRANPSDVRIDKIIKTVQCLEKRWQREITHVFKMDGSVLTAQGWDESNSPTLNDLARAEEDPQFKVSVIANYMQRVFALTHDVQCRFMLDQDPETGAELPTAFISIEEFYTLYDGTPCAENDLRDYMYSYGRAPAGWEPVDVQVVDPGPPVLWRFMAPKSIYPTCLPRSPDTDNDGMDDYWEIYHGLNPLYGGSPVVGKAGSYPEQDRADVHPWGNGSTRDWIINADPAYVRILDPTDAGLQPVPREDAPFHTPMGFPVAAAAHFDYKTRPWLAGDRFADPDQDGLANEEEGYDYLLNDVLHHTDPSPYWFTDPTYAESLVNLYYKVDGELGVTYWWWDLDLLESDADGPTYLFDFEINEGFDTDNDNISDREELTQGDNSGVTDPLDLDSPRNRKALYFDGHAAARTRNPYYHDKFSLTSYTVEFWVRPQELPAPGKRATLVQRPVLMPVDDSSGATHWRIRNTFLIQLDNLGRIIAQVDNDALETVSSVTAVSTGRLVPNHWAHVAVVMDSVGDRLAIYVNGEYAGSVGAGLKPCTGGLFGRQWQSPTGLDGRWETANLYDYSPAPIVLGANDRNPWGVVGGAYETFPWGTAMGSTVSGQSEPDFDPDQYFVGWMDEIRIWDRCRTHSEIKNAMTKRFTKEDIEEVNRKRLAWELDGWEPDRVGTNLLKATTMSDFPQKLLYHYTFDNLPDVMPARDRDTSFAEYFTADADPFPAGWQSDTVSAYRPTPFWTAPFWYHYRSLVFPHLVPWWYTAQHRSNIYTDYSYVPWIENTVAHMPQTPALDMKGLHPNWNEGTWTVSSYRYRSPLDWENDAMIAPNFIPYRQDDVVPAALPAAGSTDVQLGQIRNSMNPYGMFYRTAVSGPMEIAPNAFLGKLDYYGRYTGVPVLSDMLPLMDAVADIDVELWDGKGRGTAIEGVDTDGDGMPDWWEIAYGLDPNSADGANGAYGDPDGDGLDNYAEYLARTSPYRYDTDSDGYSDYYSRPDNRSLTYGELYDDGDGMDNAWEIRFGLDPNRHDGNADLDGDGWTNWEEYMAGTDPDRADIFPQPRFNATFYYNGENVFADEEQTAVGVPYIDAYSEKTTGVEKDDPLKGRAKMGGWYDGRYRGTIAEGGEFVKAGEGVGLNLGGVTRTFSLTANLNNVNIGVGTASISYMLNGSTTRSDFKTYATDPDYGAFLDNKGKGSLGLLHWATGTIYLDPGSDVVGSEFTVEYSVGGRSFPYSVNGMTRVVAGTHDHMVSGYNRFLGWLELNDNGKWDPGLEPMGLSIPRPSLVSWDSIETTIPLTDSLWDFPRLDWSGATEALTNLVATAYEVTFSYVADVSDDPDQHHSTTNMVGGGAYGDIDGDGLDPYQEDCAGTDVDKMDSAGDGRMDYDSQSAAGTLTWGELYDDGDMMPPRWEIDNGLDPDRYDAEGDLDDDGWTNYEEYLAGTDPRSATSFPTPKMSVEFLYAGEYAAATNGAANPALATYSQRRKGTFVDGNRSRGIYMGGTPDGVYTMGDGVAASGLVIGSDGTRAVEGVSFAATKLPLGNVVSATISVRMADDDPTKDVTYPSSPFNPELLQFANEAGGNALYLEMEAGYVLGTGDFVGKQFAIEYQVDGYTYPIEVGGFIRTKGTHAVGGYNRFFGWLDGDGDGTWSEGEPAGLSLYNAVLVGPDSVKTTVPLTDELFGFPRISWPASTNDNVTSYKVNIWAGNDLMAVPSDDDDDDKTGITVEAPRTFIHEGDYIEAGIRGIDLFDLGTEESDRYTWTVVADNGQGEKDVVAKGDFILALAPNHGPRRTMKAVAPVAGSTVCGSLVEFKWEMDWRTEGVFFTVKNSSGAAVAGLNELYVPFPVRHGRTTDDDYYYTYVPQLENGRSIVSLPSGTYTYTIKENLRTTAVQPQSVTGAFTIDNEQDGSRVRAAIKGHVHYYGRLGAALVPGKTVVQAYPLPSTASTSLGVSGNPVARAVPDANGRFELHGLSAGKYAVVGWVDSDSDGRFGPGDTQGWGFLGGSACPIQVPSWCPPLLITNSTLRVAVDLDDVHVVLRDRDTDGDGKPESWTGNAAAWKAAALRTLPAAVPAGFDWVNTYLFSTTRVARADVSTSTTSSQTITRNVYKCVVDAPRTFFHEEDLLRATQIAPLENYGTPVGYGFLLGETNVIDVTWKVAATDGPRKQDIAGGVFQIYGGTDDNRRALKARYPTQLTKVRGNVVEFEWEMDSRNAGVRFDLYKLSGPDDETGTPVVEDLTVGFPLCHGKPGTDLYYYTATPQLEDPKHFLELEDGYYMYRLTERTRVQPTVFRRQVVQEKFQLDNSGENRGLYTAEGTIRYYGKVMQRETVAELGTSGGVAADNTFDATVDPSVLAPGAMGILLVRDPQGDETSDNGYSGEGDWAEEFFNDSAADGIFYASSTRDPASSVWSGTIDYESGAIHLEFAKKPADGLRVVLVKKTFPCDLVLQVFKLADQAKTSTSVSGVPVAQFVREAKGAFAVSNLVGGVYAIRAFLDSNENGVADDWETQGVAVQTGTVSPNLDPAASPIDIRDDVKGLMIVLHDRDTDNDLLPDAWEWWKLRGTLSVSGYETSSAGGLAYWQEYADGVLDSDPRTPDTDLDGLTDAMEILVTGTDTHLSDTDGDGVGDLEEFLAGSDPNDPASKARYTVPALAFDADGVPYVDVAYPALRPGVVLTYELQRKAALGDPAWETVASHDVANDDGAVFYSVTDGVNDHLSEPGVARMLPADQAEGVDFTTGFYRVKIYADYGKMVDNGDGTWSYWTWLKNANGSFEFREAARGEGVLVRDADGNWRFVEPGAAKPSGTLYRDPDGGWKFVR
ncbi:MAG: hypothetical protein II839_12755 [Kiritimatiellae bacterium]|nr:hypothetical protein [Kiritimatiellia bacterium]